MTTKILFTARAVFETSPETVTYEAGELHDMRDDLAMRWIKRGLATNDPDAIAAAEAVKNPTPTPAAPTITRPTPAARNRRDADEG